MTLMCSDAMQQGYNEGIKEGKRIFEPKWIKCSELAPNNDKEYLIINSFESMFIAQYFDGNWVYDDHVFKNITHYTELPNPPNNE